MLLPDQKAPVHSYLLGVGTDNCCLDSGVDVTHLAEPQPQLPNRLPTSSEISLNDECSKW